MHYQAVMFDLDGTLLDTLEDLARAANTALEHMDCPTHEIDAYRFFIGEGIDVLAKKALPEKKNDDEAARQFVSKMREEYAQHWAERTRPYAGIPELLNHLVSRNLTLTICSNKPHDFTESMVMRLLPHWRFAMVLGARPGIPTKPHPASAIEIAERLAIRPRYFLYLGDTAIDMQTARAAGMLPVGVTWGFRPESELWDAGAMVVIHQPAELINLLEQSPAIFELDFHCAR